MDNRIPLPRVSAELRQFGVLVGYRHIYNAALDARIPAEVGPNGRWTVSRDDLPAIASAFKAHAERAA